MTNETVFFIRNTLNMANKSDHVLLIHVLSLHVLLIHVLSLHLLLIHVLLIHVLSLHVLLIHVLLIHVLSLHLLLIQSMFYQSSPVHILSHAQSDNMTTDLYYSGPLRDPFFPVTTPTMLWIETHQP